MWKITKCLFCARVRALSLVAYFSSVVIDSKSMNCTSFSSIDLSCFIVWFVRWFVQSVVRSFVRACVRSFVRSMMSFSNFVSLLHFVPWSRFVPRLCWLLRSMISFVRSLPFLLRVSLCLPTFLPCPSLFNSCLLYTSPSPRD